MFLLDIRRFVGVAFVALLVTAIASRAEVADADKFLYIPYNDMDTEKFGNYGPYKATDPLRQHLHLYQTPSKQPTPVYFHSHSNGATASVSKSDLEIIRSTGYSTISWESSTLVSEPGDIQDCWKDFDLVWLWFKANAMKYNLDPESVVIGGQSRGTACSWAFAYSENPEIKGIYMYDVLPTPFWTAKAKQGSSYFWDQVVTKNAPPTHFLYGSECPKPITRDCVPSPQNGNIHNPRNGQIIVDVYNKLGIGSRIQLTDGLTNNGMSAFELFPAFVASLSSSSSGRGSFSTYQSDSKDYFSPSNSQAGTSLGLSDTSSSGENSSVTITTSSAAAVGSPIDTSSDGEDSFSISSVGGDASLATVHLSNQKAKSLFLDLMIISFCVCCVVFGYDKYYNHKLKLKLEKSSIAQKEKERLIIELVT